MRTVRRKRNMWIVEEFHTVVEVFDNEADANACAGIKDEKPKVTGAIVEESLLAADANDDGILTKEEVENWFKDED
jgi:hypothetical protein